MRNDIRFAALLFALTLSVACGSPSDQQTPRSSHSAARERAHDERAGGRQSERACLDAGSRDARAGLIGGPVRVGCSGCTNQ